MARVMATAWRVRIVLKYSEIAHLDADNALPSLTDCQ